MAAPTSSPKINLTNSQRSVNKATYVPARLAEDTPPSGQVLEKAAYARSLGVTRPEYSALQAQVADAGRSPDGSSRRLAGDVVNLVARIAWSSWPDVINSYGPQLAQASRQDLVEVGLALIGLRRVAADNAANSPVAAAGRGGLPSAVQPADVHALIDLVNRADAVVRTFEFHSPVQPSRAAKKTSMHPIVWHQLTNTAHRRTGSPETSEKNRSTR